MQLLPTFATLATVVIGSAQAYPFMLFPEILGKDAISRSLKETLETDFMKRAGVPAVVPFPDNMGLGNEGRPYIFDEALQYVDLTGDNEWQAPGPTDQRGPCAGLNALANHGFISRTGVVTREDIILGLTNAVGLSKEAAVFLETTTSFFDGDPVSGRWSIGGHDVRVATAGALQESLLGETSGICALGHLKSEGDASITRGDFSSPEAENSNCRSYTDYFQQLLDLARAKYPDDGHITPSILAAHQNNRKLHSIANNPNYFSPPFAGVAFTPAAHHFVFALMSNKSAENPEGYLSPENLMSWFSYSGDPQGALTYKYGYERIPAPFYKRHPLQEWTLADILAAVSQQIAAYPDTSGVGGNTGTVNSFSGIDIGDLTGGAYNAITDLSDPAKLGCFISQNIQAEAPSFASNILQGPDQQAALSFIASTLVPTLVSSFGDCNPVITMKAKTMADYQSTYPGVTADLNDASKADSPAPGT
ncbi:hypothetical protein CBS101457_003916 [Exobasidium rhododendri]|nr:hypothetical protein CBS101457_003916 [Exobasidium rhododendri]